jgi:putative peptidoglycan lipid II flippase
MRRWKSLKKVGNHGAFTLQIGLNSLIGYLFLRVLAMKYGTTADKDSFDIAYSVPFLIMGITGFSFLHGIVTTHFSKLLADAPEKALDSYSGILTGMTGMGIAILALFFAFSHPLTRLLAPGLSPAYLEMTRRLILIMSPLVFTLGVSAYFSAVLTAYAVPVAMEFCQLVSRAGVIAWAVLSGFHFGLYQVAAGLVLFSIAGTAAEWLILKKATGLKYRFALPWANPELSDVLRQSGLFLIVALTAQLSATVMRRFATLDGVGTTASITYVLSLVAPLSLLLGKPIALTLGPEYVQSFARGEWGKARKALGSSLAACAGFSLVAVVALNTLAQPVMQLVYGGGRFSAASVAMTAGLLKIFTWSLPPSIMLWILLMPLLNNSSKRVALVAYSTGDLTQIVLSYLLFPHFGREGLAWAYVGCSCVQALLGLLFVFKELSRNLETVRV